MHKRFEHFCYWLPWVALLSLLMPAFALLSGILALPLRDAAYRKIDEALGLSVPVVVTWASRHPLISRILSDSYDLLPWLLLLAVVVTVTGEKELAKDFFIAIAVSQTIAIPLFILFPAIGPWSSYGFAGNSVQQMTEASVWALRSGGHAETAGIVCFPSFHVVWAVLSAWALRRNPLRVPAAVLASLIVLSTVTTGWHYVADVIGGLWLAVMSIACAKGVVTKEVVEWRGRLTLDLK